MRYSRQEALIGTAAQKKVARAHAVVVGAGAIGSAAAELLCRAGLGTLTLIDRDIVEESNLQRQFLFEEADIGVPKAVAAAAHLKKINSSTNVRAEAVDLAPENIALLDADIILDCTDNLETRYLIDDYCVKNKKPWIHAAAIEWRATVFAIVPGSASFRCLLPSSKLTHDTCDTAGVLASATALAACVQVSEAMKLLLGKQRGGKMLRYDLERCELITVRVPKTRYADPAKRPYEYLSGERLQRGVKFCGSSTWQVRGRRVSVAKIAQKLQKQGKVVKGSSYIRFGRMTLFADGRALIHAASETAAKNYYAKYVGY